MNRTKIVRNAGFTLVEIMVVVVILGLLATVGSMAYMGFKKDADDGIAKTRCVELEKAIESFVLMNSSDASPDEIFDLMIENKKIKRRADLKDPWGETFQVTRDDDGNYQVYSKGRDKQADTEDDIYSYDRNEEDF